MRSIIFSVLAGLLVLSGIAYYLKPPPLNDGKIHMKWSTTFIPVREESAHKFNELNPDLSVELDVTPANMTGVQKLIVQCSTGLGPDLFDAYPAQISAFAESGVAWDITEKAGEYGISTNAMWPNAINAILYKGRQYGYPALIGSRVLIYNKNVFDDIGVPYPSDEMTWNDLLELAKKVTVRDPDGSVQVYGLAGLLWNLLFESQRAEFFNDDGTCLLLEQESFYDALRKHQEACFKFQVTPTEAQLKSLPGQGGEGIKDSLLNLFAEGKFAMLINGKWTYYSFRKAYEEQLKKQKQWDSEAEHKPGSTRPRLLRLGSTILPHYPGKPSHGSIGSRTICINSKSPHREEALRFLRFISSSDYSFLQNRAMDQISPNPANASVGVEELYPDLSESQMHQNCVDMLQWGYTAQSSPFLLQNDLSRALVTAEQRSESVPDLKPEDLMRDLQLQLMAVMQRNIDRDPKLKKMYVELTGVSDVTVAYNNYRQKNTVASSKKNP